MQADLQNGIITGYNITYRSLTENDNGFVTTGPDDRQANITGLKEFVEYNISVVAFTVKGDGPPSLIVVRTDQDSKLNYLVRKESFGKNRYQNGTKKNIFLSLVFSVFFNLDLKT